MFHALILVVYFCDYCRVVWNVCAGIFSKTIHVNVCLHDVTFLRIHVNLLGNLLRDLQVTGYVEVFSFPLCWFSPGMSMEEFPTRQWIHIDVCLHHVISLSIHVCLLSKMLLRDLQVTGCVQVFSLTLFSSGMSWCLSSPRNFLEHLRVLKRLQSTPLNWSTRVFYRTCCLETCRLLDLLKSSLFRRVDFHETALKSIRLFRIPCEKTARKLMTSFWISWWWCVVKILRFFHNLKKKIERTNWNEIWSLVKWSAATSRGQYFWTCSSRGTWTNKLKRDLVTGEVKCSDFKRAVFLNIFQSRNSIVQVTQQV